MQKILTKYGLAAHLALIAVAPLFLSPVSIFWLTGLAALWMIMEPSRIGMERLHDAQNRFFSKMIKDPFFWYLVILVLVSAIRCVNCGVAKCYDAEKTIWFISSAKWSVLPGSVDGVGLDPLANSFAMLVAIQGCRNALGKSARMAFCLISSMLSGFVSLTFLGLLSLGNEWVTRLMQCNLESASYVGMFFGIHMIVGTVALVGAFERRWHWVMLPYALAFGGNFAGLFVFSPSWSFVVFASAAIISLLYCFIYARRTLSSTGEFKYLVVLGMSITIGGLLAAMVLPDSVLLSRMAAVKTWNIFPGGYHELREALSGIAFRVWKNSPWLGTGLGSFPLDIQFGASEGDWIVISSNQATALNGYWMLLAEGGIVMAVLIVCLLGFLVWTYVQRLIKGVVITMPHPVCWLGILLPVAVFVDALWDVSFLTPAVMISLVAMMAIAANSFSKEKHNG